MEFDAHYPDSHKVSVFSIPASGIVQFPEKLAYGSYAIREVEAVAPYLLRTEPVYFEVSEEHDWASDDLLEIDLPNEAATGTIKAAKIDAESKEAVAGARYEIIAKDDIATPDGTVHYKKGDVVQTVETDEQGAWTVEGLSLGNGSVTYLIVETASPDGYVAESEPREVTLSYESQTVAIVEEGITIEEQPCRLVATKKDKASKEPIEGVVLDVYRTERSSAVEEDAPFLSASTDSEGKAAFSKLPRDATYRIVEAESRIDLGYPTQHAEAALYLSPDGRWYSDFAAYEEENAASTQAQDQKQEQKEDEPDQSHQEAAPHGAIEGSVALENDFTKVSIFKVDRDAYQNMNRNQTEESETLRQGSDIRNALLEGGEFELVDEKGRARPLHRGNFSMVRLAARTADIHPPRSLERNIQSSNTKRRADTGGQKTRRHFASKTRTKYRSSSSKTKRSLRRRLRKRPIRVIVCCDNFGSAGRRERRISLVCAKKGLFGRGVVGKRAYESALPWCGCGMPDQPSNMHHAKRAAYAALFIRGRGYF